MRLYRLYTNGENKVWRKYFTFAERFICNGEDIAPTEFALERPPCKNVKIQALNNGYVIKDESFFINLKEKMPEFSKIRNVFIIKDDILDIAAFSNLKGINFIDIEIEGIFSKGYKLLTFDIAADCIDEVGSKRNSIDFFSTLVLDNSKIPAHVDGFFLQNWDHYGQYVTIVNERTQEVLMSLYKAKDFLVFKEIAVI
ncbi:MAG: hypothetical protein LBE91_03180 [Tannerella sp.]|jgi:hypothetical protein|nr:hypothetical protein [Tannerella sp.]